MAESPSKRSEPEGRLSDVETLNERPDPRRFSDADTLNSKSEEDPTTLPKMGSEKDLPPLGYDLHEHKASIAIYWTLMVVSSGVWPIALYFALVYCTDLSMNAVFGISIAIPGVLSLYTDVKRIWRLWKKDSVYRPVGETSRWAFDAFHWNYVVAVVVLAAMLAVGTSIEDDDSDTASFSAYALCSLPLAVLLLQVCPQLLVAELAIIYGMRAPFRLSSTLKGEPIKPATYVIIEDVVGVDGGGGTAFRERWQARYQASPELRAHLRLMDYVWGVGGLLVAAICFAIMFSPISVEIGFAFGWSLPWVWAGFMALFTIASTKRMLRRERDTSTSSTTRA